MQGYDLSLGRQNLIVDRFRNDACSAEGFRRIVLFITTEKVLYLTGEDNHITLDQLLEQKLHREWDRGEGPNILERHYLWYRRSGTDLILSGADSETKESFERLKAIGEANSLLFLGSLKQLR